MSTCTKLFDLHLEALANATVSSYESMEISTIGIEHGVTINTTTAMLPTISPKSHPHLRSPDRYPNPPSSDPLHYNTHHTRIVLWLALVEDSPYLLAERRREEAAERERAAQAAAWAKECAEVLTLTERVEMWMDLVVEEWEEVDLSEEGGEGYVDEVRSEDGEWVEIHS